MLNQLDPTTKFTVKLLITQVGFIAICILLTAPALTGGANKFHSINARTAVWLLTEAALIKGGLKCLICNTQADTGLTTLMVSITTTRDSCCLP